MPEGTTPHARYIKDWRKTPNGQKSLENQRAREKVRRAVIKELLGKHQVEYQVMLWAAFKEAGLEPPD